MPRFLALPASFAVLLVVFAGHQPAAAQETVTLQVSSVNAAGYPSVTVTVTVTDSSGRPVRELAPAAFSAEADRKALPVTEVAGASDPGLGIAVVLTFDVSGSMAGAPLEAAKEAGKALLGELGPHDKAAVVSFAGTAEVVQPFTQDRAALSGAINGLFASGDTALYKAVVESAQLAASAELPRSAVVLLSDGTNFGVEGDAEGSVGAAASSGTPYFVVGLGDFIDQPYLEQLAGASRGQLLLAPGPEGLNTLYENIGAILRHQYVLTIDGSGLSGGTETTLRVSVVAASGATAAGETQLAIPGGAAAGEAAPAAPAPVTAPAVGQPEPQEQEESGGSGLLAIAIATVAAAVVLGAFAWRRRRRRARVTEDKEASEHYLDRQKEAREAPVATPPAPATRVPGPAAANGANGAAYIELLTGTREAFDLPGWPVTIGYSSDCDFRLDDGAAPRWERVRIWQRDGRYMLHNLSRFSGVTVSGKAVSWVVLEDGDELQIGGHRLLFREKRA